MILCALASSWQKKIIREFVVIQIKNLRDSLCLSVFVAKKIIREFVVIQIKNLCNPLCLSAFVAKK